MPQDYFQYDRRFGDQRFQNQRFPQNHSTYNRNQPFRPFDGGCYQPNFGAGWGGNGCNPCDVKQLELQDKQNKRENTTNLIKTGALLLGGLFLFKPVLNFLGGALGIGGGSSSSSSGGSSSTSASSASEPSAEALKDQKKAAEEKAKKEKEAADAKAKELKEKNEKAAEEAKKKAAEYETVQDTATK